jgi:two-component system, NtrC family, sensor histidine kinase HydH
VAELYMLPQRLIESIHEMTRYVWLACAGSGLLIYLALVGLVMQADRQIAQQQRTIVANESLVAVGDMASAVAHGLRNPLASIRSSAELIALGPDDAQANDIMSEVDRLQAWIAKLLAYAQQGGRALTPVHLGQLFDMLLKSHAARMSKAGVTMTRDWPDDLPRVRADAPALEQALDNLIGNALDAMPQVGMSPTDLDRVFTPFHTTKRTGLGVGLPLAKRSIERLGGRLNLQSRLGEGTMAVVHLPMQI